MVVFMPGWEELFAHPFGPQALGILLEEVPWNWW